MTYDVYDLYRQAQQRLSDREAAAAIPLLELASEQIPGDRAILRTCALAETWPLTGAGLRLCRRCLPVGSTVCSASSMRASVERGRARPRSDGRSRSPSEMVKARLASGSDVQTAPSEVSSTATRVSVNQMPSRPPLQQASTVPECFGWSIGAALLADTVQGRSM